MADESSRKRLGKGLAALMGDLDKPIKKAPSGSGEFRQEPRGEKTVPIEAIRANPNNPRRHFNEAELLDLANSIMEHGIVQPILVRPIVGEDLAGAEYEIIAGERRWRAAQQVRLHEVPIIIRHVADRQALELAIIENVQRSDLNPLEEARGYQQLIDEYDYRQNDLAQVIGKSRSHVANTLRLMKLPESVRQLVGDGSLSAGHARTLVTAKEPLVLAKRIVANSLSVRQAEALAQEESELQETAGRSSLGVEKSADILAVEKRLEDALGLKVDLQNRDSGKGKLLIKYNNLDQLEEVCRRLETF